MNMLSVEISESDLPKAENNLMRLGYVRTNRAGLCNLELLEYQYSPCQQASGFGHKTNEQGQKIYSLEIHRHDGLTLSDVLP